MRSGIVCQNFVSAQLLYCIYRNDIASEFRETALKMSIYIYSTWISAALEENEPKQPDFEKGGVTWSYSKQRVNTDNGSEWEGTALKPDLRKMGIGDIVADHLQILISSEGVCMKLY